ncbi:MAG: HypC/HybG/HupF family hydrogenase formation chaperone [Chloroflexota bacterium]|nr:HypC/HybG/HupF family hydrogenase formation chaperone [Chloroflexota bacterium]
MTVERWAEGACQLDHDGCVVCSDAGIPLRVVDLQGDDAVCEDVSGNQALIAVELVHPVTIGDVLLTHGGVAIGRVGEPPSGLPQLTERIHEVRQ